MNTDALNRRRRTDVQPTGKDPQLNPPMLDLLEGLRRYHPLPPKIAFHLWPGGNYYPYFQDKLTDFTNERPDGEEPVIVRPEYFNPKGVLNSEPVWYDLSPRGRRIALSLASHPLSIPERDHMKHRAFNACVGASFEVLVPENVRHIHLEEIIAHGNCPTATRALKNPLLIPLPHGKHVEPDRLMGLERPDGFSFFGIEVDRATESNIRTVFEKLDNWITVMDRGIFRSFYGLPNFRVLFITTAPGRIDSYLDYLQGKPKADRFLFKALPNFGVHWTAPRAPIAELYEPWITVTGMKDISKA